MLEYIGTSTAWRGERIDGVAYSLDIETKWADDELAAIGLATRSLPAAASPSLVECVHAERDRRINAGFIWGGNEFQTDVGSRENISGAQGLSLGAMIIDPAGTAGLRWADPDVDFTWTTEGNVEVPMTAAQCQAFCIAAMAYKTALIKAARSLKNMQPIPEDYANDIHWPSRTLD